LPENTNVGEELAGIWEKGDELDPKHKLGKGKKESRIYLKIQRSSALYKGSGVVGEPCIE